MCCWWEVEGTRNTLEIPHFVPGSLAQPCCRVRRREWEYREPREEAVSVHLYLQLRCVQGLGLASRPELGCRSYSGALCDVSAWCGERCCCLPLTSAVLPKDFTFISPPRLLIVGAHLAIYHTFDRVSSSYYPPVYTYALLDTPSSLHVVPWYCSHTYSQLSSSSSSFSYPPSHRHEYPSANSYYQSSASPLRNIQPGLLLLLCWPGQRLLWYSLQFPSYSSYLARRKLTSHVNVVYNSDPCELHIARGTVSTLAAFTLLSLS